MTAAWHEWRNISSTRKSSPAQWLPVLVTGALRFAPPAAPAVPMPPGHDAKQNAQMQHARPAAIIRVNRACLKGVLHESNRNRVQFL